MHAPALAALQPPVSAHVVQLEAPSTLYVPGSQATHALDEVMPTPVEYSPAAHFVQLPACPTLYVPEVQPTHALAEVMPIPVEYCPVAQPLQEVPAPSTEKVSAGQT
jgi:hypothetical protein